MQTDIVIVGAGPAGIFTALELLRRTGEHPASLKDRVCSPGGTTICGVRALERAGFRSACAKAVVAACEKKF